MVWRKKKENCRKEEKKIATGSFLCIAFLSILNLLQRDILKHAENYNIRFKTCTFMKEETVKFEIQWKNSMVGYF